MPLFWPDSVAQAKFLYDITRKWFVIIPVVVSPATLFVNAPFGRFAPKGDSIFLVDGIKSWIVMELVSPAIFLYTYFHSPLSPTSTTPPASHPSTFLALAFLTHYLNRAIVSPLRTPSRSPSHILVPLSAVFFNIINGSLLGTYLSSPSAARYLSDAFKTKTFWLGLVLWAAGFFGNWLHDEVLLQMRRKSRAKGKEKEGAAGRRARPHYSIPHGYLYTYISYPNYFCEWIEWFGFAVAAAPLPSVGGGFGSFLASMQPPWVFLLAEFFVMFPRAYRGHRWYHEKFPDYPKNRKAVIPFLL